MPTSARLLLGSVGFSTSRTTCAVLDFGDAVGFGIGDFLQQDQRIRAGS